MKNLLLLGCSFLFLASCSATPVRKTSGWFSADNVEAEVSPDGFNRPSKLFLPSNYDEKDKWPLILLLHCDTSKADEVDVLLGMSKHVTNRGFLAVTPEGTRLPSDHNCATGRSNTGERWWRATGF